MERSEIWLADLLTYAVQMILSAPLNVFALRQFEVISNPKCLRVSQ